MWTSLRPQVPRTPSLAVAAGVHVYIYRNLRPYYKFTVPNLDVDAKEIEVWESVRDGKLSTPDAFDELANMRDAGTVLTSRSLDLLAMEDGVEVAMRQEQFARANCAVGWWCTRRALVLTRGLERRTVSNS